MPRGVFRVLSDVWDGGCCEIVKKLIAIDYCHKTLSWMFGRVLNTPTHITFDLRFYASYTR